MKSPLAYVGGKSKLAKTIIDLIPKHRTYCEAFTGGGWVFFHKEPSQIEVLNDLDSQLVAFYRVIQNHLEEFLKQFKWLLASREWFEDWNDQLEGRGLTDIQKAARYYYVQRLCYGGRVKGRTFGTAPERPPRINLLRMEEDLSEVHLRLTRVMIENLDYKEILKRYDKPKTFFYLDPPYLTTPVYNYNMTKIDDFTEMNEALKLLKGKFILSINDKPEIREAFKDFNIKPIELLYTVMKGENQMGKELLIRNYE